MAIRELSLGSVSRGQGSSKGLSRALRHCAPARTKVHAGNHSVQSANVRACPLSHRHGPGLDTEGSRGEDWPWWMNGEGSRQSPQVSGHMLFWDSALIRIASQDTCGVCEAFLQHWHDRGLPAATPSTFVTPNLCYNVDEKKKSMLGQGSPSACTVSPCPHGVSSHPPKLWGERPCHAIPVRACRWCRLWRGGGLCQGPPCAPSCPELPGAARSSSAPITPNWNRLVGNPPPCFYETFLNTAHIYFNV